MKKIKVVLSGLIYPMTMLHWFWKAFERRNDVELFVLGPYFGNWIPWNGGMYIPWKQVKEPHLALPDSFARTSPNSFIVNGKIPNDIDLWIQIDAGWHFSNRPPAKVVFHIQTDPHVLKQSYALPKTYSDLVFCMQTPYMETREIYLPYAFDPTIYYPIEQEKEFDACLIGLHYAQRDALVNGIRNLGYSVHYSIGEIFEENSILYNKSRLSLSWSSLQDLPARVWEGFGLGLPVITNKLPDLDFLKFIDGEDYLGFTTLKEGIDKTVWALENYDDSLKISHSAYRKVKYDHTWDKRVEYLLELAGFNDE